MSNVVQLEAFRASARRRQRARDTDRFLTKREAAEHFGVSTRTIELWRQTRGFPGRRTHGDRGIVLVRLSEAEAWLEAQGQVREGAADA